MKNRFWKKTAAGIMALLVVSGATPIQPLSQVFEDIAITASAETVTSTMFGTLGESGYYTLESKTYTLTDDVNTAGYIYVPEGVTATIDLAGHTIDRGLTSADNNGSVIIVAGTLTITDSGTGGKIQGGYDGGNKAQYISGVEVQNGATFNLQGGTLIGRARNYDYTVFVVENSNFTMTGGKITGGWTGVLAGGNVTLTGGEISGNSYSGVFVGENFSISGNPVITGNTVMNADLRSSGGIRKININGALTDGANIGITAFPPTDNAPVTVTSGYGTYNSEPVSTYFSLDNDGQIQIGDPYNPQYMTLVMGWNEDKTEIAVGTALYTVNFDMNGHGNAIDAVSLLSGYKVAEPTEPTADDWFFVDWFTDADCTAGNEYDFDDAVTSNKTLHAKWTQTAIHSITLPENMVIVSADQEAVGGKYPVGTNIRFKVKSADYVVDGDVSDGTNALTADGDDIYTVTMGDADITITATVKKAVEPNKMLSGSDNYTAQDGDVLTGSTSGTVTIADNAKITLSDVTITGGIVCEGTAEITLVGTNSVTAGFGKAGIQVGGSGTKLTIKGNGSLTANGGDQSAGIGLSRAWNPANDVIGGDILIEGGNITANGNVNDQWGAGIGTGVIKGGTAMLGTITIKGGSVKATGGSEADGIGTGYTYFGCTNTIGTVTIYDGIDKVDASSIKDSGSIVYKHEENDVTASKTDYFAIGENGNRRLIVQKPVIADIDDQTYTGSEITPEPQVTIGSINLTKGTDYEYSYTNNTNAGTAKVTVTFKGDYASLGSVEKEFNIVRATPTVTAPTANTLTYNGNEQELVTAGSTDFGKVLYSLDGETYSETIPKATNADTYTVYYKVDTDNYYYVPQTVKVTIAESYTITWKNGDEILETDNYVPGGATPEYNGETPTKYADAQYTYTFSGWSPAVDTVKGNVTYTAQFTATARRGDCGANATWCFDPDTGTLTISGTGDMADYEYDDETDTVNSPWFAYKDNITSVEIEYGVTSIGDFAFEDCTDLNSVTIPNSVTSIGEWAFYVCTRLESITIPEKVTSIGKWAFVGCTCLTSITIPASVTSIGGWTFAGCTSLTSVTIPDSVTSIGTDAFCDCTNITDVYCYAAPANLTWDEFGCDDFKKDGSTVCHVPEEHIDTYNSEKFSDVNVKFKAEKMGKCGESAYWLLDSGKLTIFGEGDMNSIGWGDYKGEITSVVIEKGITSICYGAFYGCTGLKSIEIPDSVTSIDGYVFYNCTSLTSVEISKNVTSIDGFAFAKCTSLKSVMIPDSVTSIDIYAFAECANLTSVEISKNVTSIGDGTFRRCTGLTSIKIPDSVESIGNSAFDGCTDLTSIKIPDSVTSIGMNAFHKCTNIADVYCYANPEDLTWDEGSCDDFIYDSENAPDVRYTTICHVPKNYLEDYEAKFGAESENPVNVRFVGDVDMGLGEHLYGHSITLDGSIGVNFYVELTDELLASETAAMVFTVPNGSKNDTQTLLVKDVIADDSNKVVIGSKTYYKFKCSISAKDMASEITAQLVDGEKSGTKYTYSVKDYADYLLAHPEVEQYANAAPLVKAMLNYGAYSQSYFGIEGTAANASLTDADKALGEASDLDAFEFNEDNANLPEGVTFEGATLSLKSETTLSLYFKGLAEGTKFTCDGKTVETAKNGDYVVARIRGIKASELENSFTVKFGESSETYNVTYNVMTYCYNVLNDSTVDDNLKNVCKALYKYAQAAKTYSE